MAATFHFLWILASWARAGMWWWWFSSRVGVVLVVGEEWEVLVKGILVVIQYSTVQYKVQSTEPPLTTRQLPQLAKFAISQSSASPPSSLHSLHSLSIPFSPSTFRFGASYILKLIYNMSLRPEVSSPSRFQIQGVFLSLKNTRQSGPRLIQSRSWDIYGMLYVTLFLFSFF